MGRGGGTLEEVTHMVGRQPSRQFLVHLRLQLHL